MRHVDRALTTPSRCAVLPSIGSSHELGFIDTGSELPGKGDAFDCHVYVSVVALREMMRVEGYPMPEDVQALSDRLDELETENAALVAERDDLAAKFAAIDMLASADFRARNKPGRPKKVAA